MKVLLLNCIGFGLMLFLVSSEASTYQPFVRSRYSRRRLTTRGLSTENPETTGKSIESSTFFKPTYLFSTADTTTTRTTTALNVANAALVKVDQTTAGGKTGPDDSPPSPRTLNDLSSTSRRSITTDTLRGKPSTLPTDYDYYGNGENEEIESQISN